jgi:hypothetical protein
MERSYPSSKNENVALEEKNDLKKDNLQTQEVTIFTQFDFLAS